MADTRLIQGRYRLLELIGRGGMGEVWLARDESLGRRVAVKCLKPLGPQPDSSATRVVRERFRREARAAAALQHRGVTVVHDFGEDDGVLYLVMELLEGRDLGQLLTDNDRRPLPVEEVVDIAEQVADALAYTHEHGIIHRDLKPANIMRLADGTVKICDFGIARLGHDMAVTSQLTGVGIAMGTPHYMSPEQIGAGEIDHRSDLYSLGCVLYEIATGAPPFDLEDAWSVLVGHRDTVPEPLRTHRPEIPAFFERIVLDLLAKTPEARPSDAAGLRRRIIAERAGAAPRGASLPAQGTALVPRVEIGPGPSSSAEQGLPPWSRGMGTGHKATAAWPLPTDPVAALTGEWTSPGDPHGAARAPGRPTPSPEQLAGLTDKHHAGLALGRLGHWEEAGDTHRAVAAERERLLGPDHPDTLGSHYEIGFSLSRTGRTAQALHEFGRVADGRTRTLGPDHPETLAARQETAYALGQLGRHAEAHQVYAAVLASRERTMGPEHPDTLRCRHNLAFNLGRLGRVEESYRLAVEVAAARSRVLGATHPDTLVTRYEVAHALGCLGRLPDALAAYQDVASARALVLGPDHPDTLAARYEVGISLGRLGYGERALELYDRLTQDRTRLHGPTDPETLRARHGRCVNLGRLSRWEEAVAESRDVSALRERVLGPDHPDTLVSRREIAVGLGWLGRWSDALVLYEQVSRARERVLGVHHPETVSSRSDEAHCLDQLGRRDEAAALRGRPGVHAP
ncbi:serine/threonine protein kinase [Streptomyces sp. 150FB]|uniref:serine/threonine-protein kinase n=1 Tax=Streptomyces sp. 150FB TaxID=1576605 RepID=UPI0005893F28|nr:serine/threonine-protein kinase [Streptomyces sp. 150FB]KIF72989.1 serine/threonine protein kinase [Streptomyces sp. 150FB]